MPVPSTHLYWARCPGGIAVLDPKADRWYQFDGRGAVIWEALAAQGTTDGLAEEFARQDGSDTAAGQQDAITAFITALSDTGLICEAPRRRGGTRRAR
ncbi:PqqD family protein [Streptomyces cacaoi]|uniref:PqqD family protein n=1 Tax=Streptomyces cacaoi TaxID=1898 RepID=A0A4Y3QWZ5_STRCI|nr:PqqD family protein [Streptomyces cacaoi]NNG83460.1 PqqD family protein [Streptomyces cacaoi]GEB49197.1 hypothetical protein SCA03_17480 [Streptomyces cacaoi]